MKVADPLPTFDAHTIDEHLQRLIDRTGERCSCGRSLRVHPRCKRCTILIGLGHYEPVSFNGFCSMCKGKK